MRVGVSNIWGQYELSTRVLCGFVSIVGPFLCLKLGLTTAWQFWMTCACRAVDMFQIFKLPVHSTFLLYLSFFYGFLSVRGIIYEQNGPFSYKWTFVSQYLFIPLFAVVLLVGKRREGFYSRLDEPSKAFLFICCLSADVMLLFVGPFSNQFMCFIQLVVYHLACKVIISGSEDNGKGPGEGQRGLFSILKRIGQRIGPGGDLFRLKFYVLRALEVIIQAQNLFTGVVRYIPYTYAMIFGAFIACSSTATALVWKFGTVQHAIWSDVVLDLGFVILSVSFSGEMMDTSHDETYNLAFLLACLSLHKTITDFVSYRAHAQNQTSQQWSQLFLHESMSQIMPFRSEVVPMQTETSYTAWRFEASKKFRFKMWSTLFIMALVLCGFSPSIALAILANRVPCQDVVPQGCDISPYVILPYFPNGIGLPGECITRDPIWLRMENCSAIESKTPLSISIKRRHRDAPFRITKHVVKLTSARAFIASWVKPSAYGEIVPNPFQVVKGKIPLELSQLNLLETINLDGNMLTGHLPCELGSLPRLHLLDISRVASGSTLHVQPDCFVNVAEVYLP